ncbi:AAA family ATPase [Helicobacter cetorum]|uniref:ATPase AAA-type core domain-containing protein n=1 Tax=Helicobacter cetorum (strain ATCC BAA-540 / CCUG 52418 / MIT 99-5656) TaxID=1163745 RepID=I0ES57_HELCM|nr:ATP/GTP-binding protein [Helicobacter cetorum]AFI05776.1 hypothetical protein HCD_03800 [Helicobacter cetorum MIT 99-5656]
MIQSVEIKNYKNFKHLKMENFKLINFFTGNNDTGKTNILEALYINTGFYDPATNRGSLPTHHFKNISEIRNIALNKDNLKTLFYQENTAKPISIHTKFEHTDIPLKIQLAQINDNKKIDLANDDINIKNSIDGIKTKLQLQFSYNPSLSPMTMTYEPKKRDFNLRHPNLDKIGQTYRERAIFIPIELSFIDSLKALQNLRKKSKEWELIEALQCFNPDILNAEDIDGSIYIQVKDEKLPPERIKESPKRLLDLFGWGFTKFFTTTSILIDNRIKYLFIDEIENGLHYTKMREFLKNLFKLAKKLQIQIFATTHNIEFLWKATNNILDKEPEVFKDIALFELNKESSSGFIRHSYSMLEEELPRGMEVRG